MDRREVWVEGCNVGVEMLLVLLNAFAMVAVRTLVLMLGARASPMVAACMRAIAGIV